MKKTIRTLDDFLEVMSETIRNIKRERDKLVDEVEDKKEPCEEIKDDLKDFREEFIKLYDFPDMFVELGDSKKAKKLLDQLKDLEFKINQMEEKLN